MDHRFDTPQAHIGHASGLYGAGAASGQTAAVSAAAALGARPTLDSADLFGGGNEVHIVHGDALYRLRRTALGKLILTK